MTINWLPLHVQTYEDRGGLIDYLIRQGSASVPRIEGREVRITAANANPKAARFFRDRPRATFAIVGNIRRISAAGEDQ